jgi:hypothetical protein
MVGLAADHGFEDDPLVVEGIEARGRREQFLGGTSFQVELIEGERSGVARGGVGGIGTGGGFALIGAREGKRWGRFRRGIRGGVRLRLRGLGGGLSTGKREGQDAGQEQEREAPGSQTSSYRHGTSGE